MIFAANWKMYKTPEAARHYLERLSARKLEWERHQVVVFPSPLLAGTFEALATVVPVHWGGQNAHWQMEGAFTGESSPQVLRQMGASHCLLGHSERRRLFHETNQELARKVPAVQKAEMIPVLCVGETLEERDAGRTESVIEEQLRLGLEYADFRKDFWVAYEPVWAIGTGRVAIPETVLAAHAFIRSWLVQLNPEFEQVPILYGGSAKPDNVGALAKVPNVSGFLVGGASLDVDEFIQLIHSAESGPQRF